MCCLQQQFNISTSSGTGVGTGISYEILIVKITVTIPIGTLHFLGISIMSYFFVVIFVLQAYQGLAFHA
jgi:hypothetical protein